MVVAMRGAVFVVSAHPEAGSNNHLKPSRHIRGVGFAPHFIVGDASDREQVSALIISLQTWLDSDSFAPKTA
jgi:hypothetical protein